MKNKTVLFAIIILFTNAFISCKKEKKEKIQEAAIVQSIESDNTFKVIFNKSIVNWKANQIGESHNGTFNVESGIIKLDGNSIVGGNFIIDIKSLKVIDVTEIEDNKDIVSHLLNPDFFDSDKYPKAYFTITSVANNVLSGNLKMKDIEKNISFPIQSNIEENEIHITSDNFVIDRTLWEITYSSGKFFDPVKLGDHLIKDDVEMSINIVSKK